MKQSKVIVLILVGLLSNLYSYAGNDFFADNLKESELEEIKKYLDILKKGPYKSKNTAHYIEFKKNVAILKEKKIYKSLSEDEYKSFDEYQLNSDEINSALVNFKGNPELLEPETKALYDNLISGLEKEQKLNFTNKMTSYEEYPYVFAAKRQSSVFVDNEGSRTIDVNDFVVNDGFVSTSNAKQVFYEWSDSPSRNLKIGIKTLGNQPLLETMDASEAEVLIRPKHLFRVVAIRDNSIEGNTDISVILEEVDKSSEEYKELYASGIKAKELTIGEERELPEPESKTEELEGACAW